MRRWSITWELDRRGGGVGGAGVLANGGRRGLMFVLGVE